MRESFLAPPPAGILSRATLAAFLVLSTITLGAPPIGNPATKPGPRDGFKHDAPKSAALPGAFTANNRLQTPALDVNKLIDEDRRDDGAGPARVGIVQDFNADSSRDGHWNQTPDGGSLWTMTFHAPGAHAVRLRIRPWKPPHGAELIVYPANDPTHSFGPLDAPTRTQTLWTPIVGADTVNLEYYLPVGVDAFAADSPITVDGLLNIYYPFGGGPNANAVACHLDVMCFPAFAEPRDGVADWFLTTDMIGFVCSGGMLNRVDAASDFTPLFLTATHCGVNNANVDSMIVVWFWQSNSCNGTLPNWMNLPQTAGETVLAQDVVTDWTLVGLRTITAVPGGTVYLGWDPNELDDDESVTGIHHPRGDFKRISFGTKLDSDGVRPNPDGTLTCISGEAHQVNWPAGNGLLQPGSSGSPLFDDTQRVRGTLSCSATNCPGGMSTQSNSGHYGRLDQAFGFLEPWLDPVDPVFVDAVFGGQELGTPINPFNSVIEGAFAVIAGSTVNIEFGSYPESFVLDKPMTLQSTAGPVLIGQ